MDKTKYETFIFRVEGIDYEHEKGNRNCPECWQGYPQQCECGGLIHAEFGDENYDGDYWLYYKCDKCDLIEKPRHKDGAV